MKSDVPAGYHAEQKMDLGKGKGLVDDVSTRIGSCSESVSTEADWGDITDLEKAAKKAEKRRRQKEEKRAKAGV